MTATLVLLTCCIVVCGSVGIGNASIACEYVHFESGGFINKKFVKSNTTALSELDCLMSSCECSMECVITFHRESGICLSALISPMPLEWMKECLFIASNDSSWTSITRIEAVQRNVTWNRPSGLWMLDNVLRGCNLGSHGHLLDSSETGIAWSVIGPRGSGSNLRYARLGSSTRPKVQILHGGSVVLDFLKPISLLLWLKTDSVTAFMPIIEGRSSLASNGESAHIWFATNVLNQIWYRSVKGTKSTVNNQDRNNWRHMAFIYLGSNQYETYLNAQLWPEQTVLSGMTVPQPTVIQFGYREPSFFFQGSMACIAIYEKAMTASEIKSVMTSCP